MKEKIKYVYHGSTHQGLKIIKRNKSTHGKAWVYATLSKAISTIFISNKGSDLYYYLSGDGTENNPVLLVERKEGMFKDIFNVSGSLYTLSGKNFISGKTGWAAEVVSEFDENVIHEEYINNVFEKLKELNNKGELKLYLYPNRPSFLPKDNSDLIPKVIRWQKKGINIEQFFKIYPELKEKYLEKLKRGETMVITMKEEGKRFGVRVGAIIYNEDKSKILLENQDNGRYMFPGGRIDVHEDSDNAIVRELKEELNLSTNLKLKYVVEMFLSSPKTKYHEIGFYYLTTIKEETIKSGFKSLDGDGIFEWISIQNLENHKILAKPIKEKVVNKEITNEKLEHIIYREY